MKSTKKKNGQNDVEVDSKEEEKGIDGDACKLTTQELKSLSYLPNLQSIDFHDSDYYRFYMNCLAGLDNSQYLQHIKEISRSESGFTFNDKGKDYLEACYNFRSTITRLFVVIEEAIDDDDVTHDNIYNALPDFKQLKNLKFYNDTDENLTTFDIQRLYPSLTSLEFLSGFKIPDDRVVEELSKPVNATKYNNLKNLVVHFSELTVSYVNYLKARFLPSSLNKLWIIIDDMDIFDWMRNVGMDTALDLAHYVSCFSNGRLAACPDKEDETT